ncbi:tetratricopeptide repeat protein [Ktedonobacteria bacterium brp13]|nr:tetratricopeptide repeat protein [Ktedonobacteria bacterium brp13]
MTQALTGEEKARLKKQWTDLAVKLAQEGQWEEAVNTNKNIVNIFPQEPDAYNRLGKAYSELGYYAEARQAYTLTMKYSPNNSIARKNLDRLQTLPDRAPTAAPMGAGHRIDPRLFIEETGKTGVTTLINLAPASVLSRVSRGDRVNLVRDGHRLQACTAGGEVIGQVEPRLAARLIDFISRGNQYAAGILAIDSSVVRLNMREEYQSPDTYGEVSFPSQGANETIRAYIKDSMLRHDREDDDDLGTDDEYYDGGDDGDDMSEFDFENTDGNNTEE